MLAKQQIFRHFRRFYCQSASKQDQLKALLDNAATFEDVQPQTSEDQWATTPYPAGVNFRQSQAAKSVRPKIDPKETSIIVFPGQGAQYVGMGRGLMRFPKAKEIYKLANEVLGYDLLKLCLEGPVEKLNSTRYCQPAVMVTSLACLERLKEERPRAIENCFVTAGFSLGEITALIFAGAIPFDKGLQLVQVRAEAMEMASEQAKGGMATVLFGPDSKLNFACLKAREYCMERGIENPECHIANYLYPHCKVVAGHEEALKYLEQNKDLYKLRRVRRLPVSGAFHTSLMAPAVEVFRKALKRVPIEPPIIHVHSNVDGERYRNVEQIIKQLPKQIVKPVRWEQMLHILYERQQGIDFPRTFECGPGKGLTAILKQVNAKASDVAFNIEP